MWFWNYSHLTAPFAYGPDTTYQLAAKFLDGGPVEDWGCGTAYAKRFFPNGYVGIDQAAGFADRVEPLGSYRYPLVHGILLRHVLEHNDNWDEILEAAIHSCEKLCVIIFTPFGEETKVINTTTQNGVTVPDISFRKSDLINRLPSFTEESVESNLVYGRETLFYWHNPWRMREELA